MLPADLPVLLRTDFDDDGAWDAVCAAAIAPQSLDPGGDGPLQVQFALVSHRQFAGLDVAQVLALPWPDPEAESDPMYAYVADRLTMTGAGYPVLVVSLFLDRRALLLAPRQYPARWCPTRKAEGTTDRRHDTVRGVVG